MRALQMCSKTLSIVAFTPQGAVDAWPPLDAKRPANQPETYEVPAGFDAAAALVECDLGDAAAARRALPWAFLQRWLALRDEVRP
jgi:hypothetical protein